MARVLIIEDDTEFRDHLANLIQRKGHEVITADDGEDALFKLHGKPPLPSLILLDLMMPEMDGWTFRARILAEPALAKIPIVVLSGIASIDTEWQKLGVVDRLSKPVNLDKLYRLIADFA